MPIPGPSIGGSPPPMLASSSSVSTRQLRMVEALVAGRKFARSFPATPNQRTSFAWDGKDAHGRTLRGAVTATVRVGYKYEMVYLEPAEFSQSFASFPDPAMVDMRRGRMDMTIWQEMQRKMSGLPPSALVGGWSLSPHHAYDPQAPLLYLGDGSQRSAQNVSGIITTVAGGGGIGYSGDGGPATQAMLDEPVDVAVGPDGSAWIADRKNHRIRRVGPDGIITTVAGITTDGSGGYSGDGGPATQARLNNPQGVAVGPDGSVWIADGSNARIRRVGPDGIITTVAGTGTAGYSGDGGPATQARLFFPYGVAVGPDGSVWIADWGNERIRRVEPNGIITTVAGTGTAGYSGDGGPATQALLNSPYGVAVGPDGSVWIADLGNERIRRVGPDGIITTVVGTGQFGFSGDGGPATQARINGPLGLAFGPDGSVWIALIWNNLIRQVKSSFPSFNDISDFFIASEDGRQLYRFSAEGRHLSTLDTLTGAVLYTFGYDSAGRLITITD
ncbi:MAG: hypothetical protein F9K25_20545, partial [Candidatus Contendobacter sp.]